MLQDNQLTELLSSAITYLMSGDSEYSDIRLKMYSGIQWDKVSGIAFDASHSGECIWMNILSIHSEFYVNDHDFIYMWRGTEFHIEAARTDSTSIVLSDEDMRVVYPLDHPEVAKFCYNLI